MAYKPRNISEVEAELITELRQMQDSHASFWDTGFHIKVKEIRINPSMFDMILSGHNEQFGMRLTESDDITFNGFPFIKDDSVERWLIVPDSNF